MKSKKIKVVIPGGTGKLGQLLARNFRESGDEVVVLGRRESNDSMHWDGKTIGPWAQHIDDADVVINLAGRSVNCRYTEKNLKLMMDSRVESTRVVGEAIGLATNPPKVWLQMSTATIYAHRYDAANDEMTGVIGGNESDVPGYWGRSIKIAKAWERALDEAILPGTRKVALRTAMVMSPDEGGIFHVLTKMTRAGLGGKIGNGQQFVSWIHEQDFANAIRFLIAQKTFDGPVNLSAPNPLPQKEFQQHLRAASGVRIGLPATKWMAEFGAFVLRTDTELLLKSRRVVPGRLLDAGFHFEFPNWEAAAMDLAKRSVSKP